MICAETDIACRGGFYFERTEICADKGIGGDFKVIAFESVFDGVCEGFFDGGGEVDSFDTVRSEGTDGIFGELTSDARLIDGDAAEVR